MRFRHKLPKEPQNLVTQDPVRLKRLCYRAWHRGFKEADLILGPFADAFAATMAPQDLDAFEALLAEPCGDVYAWVMGPDPAPTDFETPVLERLRDFVRSGRIE